MHLCKPCGETLVQQDRLYSSGWQWRSKYREYVGVAEGNKGVECGRHSYCVTARLVEQELDCDVDVMKEMEEEAEKVAAAGTGRSWEGGSFAAQEVEGVGGVVKMKVKRLVRVGAEVDEFDDDDAEGSMGLEKEIRGETRSWCAWCRRVIPSKGDHWDHSFDVGGAGYC